MTMQVTLKQSKTDPFRHGVTLTLGATGQALCTVAAMADYLMWRGLEPGALFKFSDGRLLTRKRLVAQVQQALQGTGIDASKYTGHSFRMGAATITAAGGFEDSLIKTLGRWESSAYMRYIRIPREQLAQYTRSLLTQRLITSYHQVSLSLCSVDVSPMVMALFIVLWIIVYGTGNHLTHDVGLGERRE